VLQNLIIFRLSLTTNLHRNSAFFLKKSPVNKKDFAKMVKFLEYLNQDLSSRRYKNDFNFRKKILKVREFDDVRLVL
jgi:hypothetical protein